MEFEEQLRELLEKLNLASQDKYKYSAKITTNAKGEAQIHCSVKSNESVDDARILLESLIKKTIQVVRDNNLKMAGSGS